MRIDLAATAKKLLEADNILILTHAHPDGDTLGAGFGLAKALQQIGKEVALFNSDSISEDFRFMFGTVPVEDVPHDYLVAVDVADPKLLGKSLCEKYGKAVDLCIDHHATNLDYAADTYVDAQAAAACEIIYEVILLLGAQMNADIAACLYTGLSTDTGCFRYSNTTAKTMRTAAALMEFEFPAAEINRVFFETKTRAFAKLERLALDDMQFFFDDRCAVICVTKQMFAQSGTSQADYDKIPPLTRQIEGVLVGVAMREVGDGAFKASLRTHEPIDAAAICAKMGGGGHARAAGCTVHGTKEEVLRVVLHHVGAALMAMKNE